MAARNITSQTGNWVKVLLPACNNDRNLAKRQLAWLKEKVAHELQEDPSKPLESLSEPEKILLENYIKQRAENHKPLQYILGDQPFCELDILTRPPTLIPRWETEEWTYKLIELIKSKILTETLSRKLKILEFCSGSGCISLALAKHLPYNSAEVTGLDISPTAISLAKENLSKHKEQLQNDVQFLQHDLFDPQVSTIVPGYNLIVANPPYVTNEEYKSLEPDVKDWEDKIALVAHENGTSVLKKIIELSKHCHPVNRSAPYLFMEFGGAHQVPALKRIMQQNGFSRISIWKDLADKDRVITGF